MPETVVITGASAGVGRATAHAFAAQRAQIGLMARGTRGLQLWATEHRGEVVAGTLAIAAFLTTLIVGGKPLARKFVQPIGL